MVAVLNAFVAGDGAMRPPADAVRLAAMNESALEHERHNHVQRVMHHPAADNAAKTSRGFGSVTSIST